MADDPIAQPDAVVQPDTTPQPAVDGAAITTNIAATNDATALQATQPQLAPLWQKSAIARSQGYSWDEIGAHLASRRAEALSQGYTNEEVNAYLGMPPNYGALPDTSNHAVPVVPSGFDQAADTVRKIATTYFTPSFQQSDGRRDKDQFEMAPIRSTKDFFDMLDTSVEDFAKIFGNGALQGLAAGLEMMDGKERSTDEWTQLNAEATNFTGFFAGGLKTGGGFKGTALRDAARPMPKDAPIPATRDVVDAAASIVHSPEMMGSRDTGVAPMLPILNMKALSLASAKAQLQATDASIAYGMRNHMEVAPDAAEARTQLAKVNAVDVQLEDPTLIGDDRKALMAKRDELLTNTNPETLKEKADALTFRESAETQRSNIATRVADIEAEQARMTAEAATNPVPEFTPTLSSVARQLGQNFMDTGEHPLDAASRAQGDALLMQRLTADPRFAVESGAASPVLPPEALPSADLAARAENNVNAAVRAAGAKSSTTSVSISGNTVFTEAAVDTARARLRASSRNLNAGVNPRDYADMLLIAGYHVERGARTFAEFSSRMIGDLGEAVRPHLRRLFDEASAGGTAAPRSAVPGGGGGGGIRPPPPGTAPPPVAAGPPMTPATITTPHSAISRGVVDNFKRIFNPASRDAEAELTGQIVREGAAQQAQRGAISNQTLREFGRAVASLTKPEQAQFLHDYETGVAGSIHAGTPLGVLAEVIHDELNSRWDMMDARGIAPGYIDDYLPHLYADPGMAARKLEGYYAGSRAAGGAKAFTKERLFSTFLEAANHLGLEPLTTNPLELVMTHLFQADKFITAHDIVTQLKDAGLIRQMPSNPTRAESMAFGGMVRVDPSIARGGSAVWMAPEPVATILNRWLSPGLTGQPIFDLARSAGNMLNMAQLGISGFHAGFVTAEAGANAVAKGIKQISRGTPEEIARGVGSVATAPFAPLTNALVGWKVIKQVLGTGSYGGDIPTIADALIAGGGRIHMDEAAHGGGSAMGSFWQNMRGSVISGAEAFAGGGDGHGPMTLPQAVSQMYQDAHALKLGQILPDKISNMMTPAAQDLTIVPAVVRATALILPRVMSTIMAPLMQGLVPIMKAGGFANLMRDELRANPTMTPVEVRAAAQRIMHSIDNRLGEMVYENRFWDKNQRDMGQIAVRALGWTVGTVDEIAGGAIDLAQGRKVPIGAMHQLSDRASYVVAMPIWTAMMGAMFGTVYGTWNSNWGIKDYMFPPTGGKDVQGGPERASMPGYTKDTFEWGTAPAQTALNKGNPLWSTVYDMMNNQQWNGAAITDPRKEIGDRSGDYARYIADQFTPMSLHSDPRDVDTALSPFVRQLGLKPAPYAIREPERNAAFGFKEMVKSLRKKMRTDPPQ